MNDYDYLINQLNLLIGFLDVSEQDVYDQIKHHDQFGLGQTIEQLYDNRYENYSNHISTSATLLGFAHIEDFITKCIARFLVSHPHKNDKKVALRIIKEKGDDLITYLAVEQSRELKFSDKIKFIEKNIPGISLELISNIKLMNDVRNCIMHNNGIADSRIVPKYIEGQKITLTAWEVNEYGVKARKFATELWEKVQPRVI